jgi:hypothetical protein
VTPAFKELRDSVFPKWQPPKSAPVEDVRACLTRWHLNDFSNNQLNERIEQWVMFNVFERWRLDPQSQLSENLGVDCGWKDRARTSFYHPVPAALSQWDPMQEEFGAYRERLLNNAEKYVQEQKRIGDAEMDRIGAKPYSERDGGHPPSWNFEWLALSICMGFSPGKIALRTKYKDPTEISDPAEREKWRQVIKKAIKAKKELLRIPS